VFIEACQRAGAQGGDARTRVISSLQRSIADQVVDEAERAGGALSLTVVSPFFGSSIAAVQSLADKLNVAKVSVLSPARTPEQFPFDHADAAKFKISPVTGPLFSEDPRKLHAKLIEVVCRRGTVCVSGSTNATSAALRDVQNVEVGILRVLAGSKISPGGRSHPARATSAKRSIKVMSKSWAQFERGHPRLPNAGRKPGTPNRRARSPGRLQFRPTRPPIG
jgi:hypothetical protein